MNETLLVQTTDPLIFYSRVGLAIVVLIIIFLILREFWLWYWKVNKVVSLLEKIEKNTSPPNTEIIKK